MLERAPIHLDRRCPDEDRSLARRPNQRRPHGSLGRLTPDEYAQRRQISPTAEAASRCRRTGRVAVAPYNRPRDVADGFRIRHKRCGTHRRGRHRSSRFADPAQRSTADVCEAEFPASAAIAGREERSVVRRSSLRRGGFDGDRGALRPAYSTLGVVPTQSTGAKMASRPELRRLAAPIGPSQLADQGATGFSGRSRQRNPAAQQRSQRTQDRPRHSAATLEALRQTPDRLDQTDALAFRHATPDVREHRLGPLCSVLTYERRNKMVFVARVGAVARVVGGQSSCTAYCWRMLFAKRRWGGTWSRFHSSPSAISLPHKVTERVRRQPPPAALLAAHSAGSTACSVRYRPDRS